MSQPADLLARLSIAFEVVDGGPGYHILLLDSDGDGGDQIGLEDEPGTMILDFSDEALLENAELPEEDAHLLQQHREAVIDYVSSRGYRPLVDDADFSKSYFFRGDGQ